MGDAGFGGFEFHLGEAALGLMKEANAVGVEEFPRRIGGVLIGADVDADVDVAAKAAVEEVEDAAVGGGFRCWLGSWWQGGWFRRQQRRRSARSLQRRRSRTPRRRLATHRRLHGSPSNRCPRRRLHLRNFHRRTNRNLAEFPLYIRIRRKTPRPRPTRTSTVILNKIRIWIQCREVFRSILPRSTFVSANGRGESTAIIRLFQIIAATHIGIRRAFHHLPLARLRILDVRCLLLLFR
mmetsp:Transcript_7528/g.12168  ORF Transcript_7528/g.12168 Transcript_7528/m.12168 type:complete len:238 (+) Transcript_7528:396-1109(+)